MRYRNDPYQLNVRFNSTCEKCKLKLVKGSSAYYWPLSKKVYCLVCGETDYQAFLSSAMDEDFYSKQY
ncbi:MAG: hypothetical protein V1775_00380 [Bacteroidota bacterium]